jgi:maleate isomerase
VPDRLGYRAKWGLVVPVRNTVCETEFHSAVPAGITINTSRSIRTGPEGWSNDSEQLAMARGIREGEPAAIQQLLAARPDYMVIGEGGFSFSKAEHDEILERYKRIAGLGVATSAHAFLKAIEAMGFRKIAVMTIRIPDTGVVSGGLWEECGYEVAAAKSMNTHHAFDIVNIDPEILLSSIGELAASPAEAILATGSNFALMHLVEEAERRYGKPVLHINSVLLWHALRENGFEDRIPDRGVLLRDY